MMICDCLPIVGVLLAKNSKSRKNFSADRPLNRRARRAGIGKQSPESLLFGWSIWTAGVRAPPETVKRLKYSLPVDVYSICTTVL